LQDGKNVLVRQALRGLAQFRLEVEQHRAGNAEHDGKRLVAVPDHRAIGVAEQQGDHRGGAGVLRVGMHVVSGNHHHRHGEQPGGEYPGRSGFFGKEGERRAEQAHQTESAQAGTRRGIAFALQTHEEAQAEGDAEILDEIEADGGYDRIVHGVFLAPGSVERRAAGVGGCLAAPPGW
jgi:hypothetical protein